MIYTLQYIKEEAEDIAGHWNGSDDKFVDGNGDIRTEEDVHIAVELLDKVKEVGELIKALGI